MSADGGVAAASVVALEVVGQGTGAVSVAGPGRGVGPFGLQGPVAPFGFAVLSIPQNRGGMDYEE